MASPFLLCGEYPRCGPIETTAPLRQSESDRVWNMWLCAVVVRWCEGATGNQLINLNHQRPEWTLACLS